MGARYARGTRKDLSATLSGVWLANLELAESKPGQLRLVAYLRLSVAKLSEEDHLKALQRQLATCQALAKKMGGTIVAVYCDMARTADSWKGTRPEFLKMVEALPSYDGLVGAQFFRVARDNEDVGPLCRLYAEPGNSRLLFSVPDRDYDPRTLTGRAAMQAEAARGLGELAEASDRQAKRHAQLREAGRYVGHRPFGITGPDNDEVLEEEAQHLRKAALDVVAGKNVPDILRDWQEAGVVGTNGQPMTRQTIRDLLLTPRIVGYLVVKPKRGETAKPLHERFYVSEQTGEKVRSQVPPILALPELDEDGNLVPDLKLWNAVVETLRSRGQAAKGTSRKGKKALYLCSGLCWALKCGQPMNGQWVKANNAHVYRCDDGCTSISGPGLDAYVSAVMETLWTEQAVAVVKEPEPFAQQADLDYWLAAKAQNAADFRARKISLSEKNENHADIMAELAPIQEAWMAWNKSNVRPVSTTALDRWQAATSVHVKRAMLHAELERIDIAKSFKRGPQGVDASRVTLNYLGAQA
jgi:DNA invertase Pin-like site-specific DNA recombinase